MLGKLNANI